MQVKYNLVVDFARPNKSNTILIAENDANTRHTLFTLLNDKAPFDMSDVTTATLQGITPSGAVIFDNVEIVKDEEGNNTNVLSYVIPAPLADTAGNITLTITLQDNHGGRITSFEFYLKIRNALYNEDDYIDDDDMAGFRDLLARTRAALEKMEQMVQEDALPNPYPIRISLDNVDYEYNGESLVEILRGEVAYLGDVIGTAEITADDSAAAQAARSAAAAADSAGDAAQSYSDMQILLQNFDSQIPTATVTKNIATHQSIIVITDKNGTTTATVEDGVVGSSWYEGTDLTGEGTNITGYAGNEGDFYLNGDTGKVYKCTQTGSISTALWDYQLTMGSNCFGRVKINTTIISASGDSTLELKAGSNITLTPDATNNSVTISATGGGGGGGGGDMYTAVYDTNGGVADGIVDCADTLNGLDATITELNYVHGVTAGIQAQFNGKADSVHTHTMSQITDLAIPDDLADLNDDSTHRLVTDTEKSTWNGKQDVLTAGTGISIDSTTNTISATASTQLGYKTVTVGSTDIDATQAEDAITFVPGANVTITPDAINKTITIASTGGGGGGGGGDMLKSIYDNKGGIADGIVNCADTLDGLQASVAELNYVKNVTSNVQDQLDGKAASSHTHAYSDIVSGAPTIPTTLAELATDTTHKVVTDNQIATWNSKQNALTAGTGITISGNTISATGSVSLSALDDVDITPSSLTGGEILKYNAASGTEKWQAAHVNVSDLEDTSISTPTPGQILQYQTVGGQTKLQNVAMPQGGHNMLNNSTIISGIKGAITEGTTNDDVVSGYGVGVWSNTDTIKLLTTVAQGDDSVGTWEADDTWESGSRAYWLKHESLHGILSDDDVEISLVFDVSGGEAISCLAYRIDDAITSSLGGIAIKFNAPIQSSGGATVGVVLKHNRTKTSTITRTS